MNKQPIEYPERICHILVTIFALLLPSYSVAQAPTASNGGKQYYFRNYDGHEGLAHNTVNKIMEDRLGFIWFGTKDGLNRLDGTTFKVFNKENSTLGNNCVVDIFENQDGNLWIGTDEGLYIYNPVMETFSSINDYARTELRIAHTVTHIKEDAQHNIWFSVDQEGLYCYDAKSHRLTMPFKPNSKQHTSPNISDFFFTGNTCWIALYNENLYYSTDHFKTLVPYKDNHGAMPFYQSVVNSISKNGSNLYLCTSEGLFVLDPKDRACRKLLDGYVRTVAFAGDELWAGTEKGLCIYNQSSGTMKRLTISEGIDPYSLADNAIYSVFRDSDGGMWIGSYFGGVNYCPMDENYFEKYYPHEGMMQLGRRVREFCKDHNGTIWIGTEDKGLFSFNPHTRQLTPFKDPLIYSNVHGLCQDGDQLWVGTFSGGLNRIDLRTRKVKNYRQGQASNTLCSNSISSICLTREGKLLIGSVSGLMTYNPGSDDFTREPQLKEKFVDYILEDKNGTLWFATYANGVYRYNPKNKQWRNYRHKEGDKTSLSYDRVINIFEDSKGRLWIMTQGGGICRYNPKNDSFSRIDMSKGLPSNIVYKMVEDGAGQLWLSTNNGLACLNPENGHIRIYTTADGLLSNQFNYQSGLWDADNGMIYMGCIQGFITFNPASFKHTPAFAPVYITELYIFNKHITVGSKGSPLKKSLLYSDKITLSANENSISLKAANLSACPGEDDDMQYKLEGFDHEWMPVNKDGMIYFSNLPYRHFTLKIRGVDSTGKSNGQERSLEITVLPPFYLTGWAYTLYVILAIVVTGMVMFRIKSRIVLKQNLAMRMFEQAKERELYNSKITFFTNITHEIRTPLTLIKGPLDNILSHAENIPAQIKEDLKIMESNTGRLLTLVNQLLDFRKTETNGLKPNLVRANISQLLQELCTNFTSTLSNRHIRFDVEVPNGIEATVDTEAFTKIVSNLLSNAMKHAETYIRFVARVQDGQLQITVENDGDIIPLSMRESIFKPFVQYKDFGQDVGFGTGLGLTLARSLAELHHGTLAMDEDEEVNRFVFTLPLVQEGEIKVMTEEDDEPKPQKEIASTTPATPEKNEKPEKKPYTLLIVEDNKDMRHFIVKTLAPTYNVLTAEDGLQAIEVLKNNVVNLIISDIMMPHMDGIALCNWVKSTLDYSHIPVILLTAKTTLSSKIEGTKQGADAYIEKPFSIDYLKVETENLLTSREKLRQLFTQSPYTQTSSVVSISKTDSEFLKKVHEVVMNNLSNADFSLDDLASMLSTSKSSLHRKFRGLLDITPNDYIRIERLKQAAVLLKSGETRVSEVCYQCGFNTPSYFAKCFYQQFGVLPTDFASKSDAANGSKA